jgi:hypothetical protein
VRAATHLGVALALVLGAAAPARAGWYWGHSTLSSTPSVCFVGNAITEEPAWTALILTYIQEFEQAANIRFEYLGKCPDPLQVLGFNYYGGDLRVALFPGSGLQWTDPVPGTGCTIGFVDSSFGREPDFLNGDRVCMYNLKLGKDSDPLGVPWRNHTLHEFGHSLGLAHEHQRPDALNSSCQPMTNACPTPPNPGVDDALCMTPYDRDSVMNYENLSCGIHGNYGQSGLSTWDRLSFHILYPESAQVAEVVGTRVIETRNSLSLALDWERRGAIMAAVARNFSWTIGGFPSGTGTSLGMSLAAGSYAIGLQHEDFLGRSYAYATTVQSLSPDAFARTISGPTALLAPEPDPLALAGAALLALAGRRLAAIVSAD